MAAVIALLTDFGLSDPYAGVMKGVILSVLPSAKIVDLTHRIAPQDIAGAAYALYSSYRYFPDNTVYVVVVDPGVGGARQIVAVKTGNRIFVAPDNGVLTPVVDAEAGAHAVSVKNPEYFCHPVSRTFHGRDIFSPVAAHLAAGKSMARFGPSLSVDDLVRLEVSAPAMDDDGCLAGTVIAVDRFGNLITNIGTNDIYAAFGGDAAHRVKVRIDDGEIAGICETYRSVPSNRPLAIIGSGDMLEISVNGGDAAGYFRKGRGDKIRVCL
ncbi:MAG: SAM hydrolase/SAM-dependent halogenase family protein [Thermodesulfobacteriota bacterium]